MEGKPFVLIGVNSDKISADELKKKNENQQITWRSFKNDRGDKDAISGEWGVRGWPTIFLIDGKGVIRNKWVGSPGDEKLDKAIEDLVKEQEAGGGKKG
jgi:hypothetical protein